MTIKQWKTVGWYAVCVLAVSALSACGEKNEHLQRAEKNAEARKVQNNAAAEKRNR